MLYFEEKESEPILATERHRCVGCGKRVATWRAPVIGATEKAPMCAWCLMYDTVKSEWGHRFRDEMLHVGRTCVGMAAQFAKPIPVLDDLGRLSPEDAEKFVLGVAFTSRMLRGPLGVMADARP